MSASLTLPPFAPQRPLPGQQRLLGAVDDLVRRGRARGLGVTLVTQRAAVLSKDVLTQIEVLIALRTIAPQDRDAIDAWIKVHGTLAQREALMVSLPSLPIGSAWFWSPGWLDIFQQVQVRRRDTFDSSATPKVGEALHAPQLLAPIDLDRLREWIAATLEQAQADDPRELRRRIADLEKQVSSHAPATKIEKIIERVKVPVIGDAQIAQFQSAIAAITALGNQLAQIAQDLGTALAQALPTQIAMPAPITPEPQPAAQRRPTTSAQPKAAPERPQNGETPQLRTGERRMLQVLARHYPMKVTRAQLGTLSQFTASGGTFGAYFSTLKRHGLLDEVSGDVQITRAGMDFLGADVPPRPQTTAELLELWRGALRAGERKLLDELVAVYPHTLSRAELGERAGYTASGGTFGAYLGTLRRNGLIAVDGDAVRASETLFLNGAMA